MKTVHQDGMMIEFDCEAVMRDGTIIRYDFTARTGKGNSRVSRPMAPTAKECIFLRATACSGTISRKSIRKFSKAPAETI